MHILVSALVVKPLAVASMHAFTDATRAPRQLLPYAVALVPLPPGVTICAFVASSVAHFASDVGVTCSVALHATCAQ